MAAYALSILKGNVAGVESPPEPCLQKLNRPDPRVSLGQKLRDVASAAIDISDGLAGDLSHILDASNVGAEIRIGNVPVSDGMKHLSEEELRTYCLYSGDDYELCFTVDEQHRDILEDITGEQDCLLTCIGRIIPGRGITWLSESGGRVDAGATGFRHF
jgi:thiamine-monophosphate kinase